MYCNWPVHCEFALVQKVHASMFLILIEMSAPVLTSLLWTFLDMVVTAVGILLETIIRHM